MLIFDFHSIGNKLLYIRKKKGFTQADVAEAAGLSDRTYAEIERGTVNMRIETILRICNALQITPNEILTEDNSVTDMDETALLARLKKLNPSNKETALRILSVYLNSID